MIHGAGVDVGSTQTKAVIVNEGRQVVLLPDIAVVEAGVTRLIELSEKGWTIVRP